MPIIARMRPGRPIDSTIAREIALPFVEQLGIDPRGRISIPVRVRTSLAWLDSSKGTQAVICELVSDGSAELRAWAEEGKRLETDARSIDVDQLIALRSRFHRLSIDKSGRLTLPALVEAHLTGGSKRGRLIVGIFREDEVELLPPSRWRDNYLPK